MIASHICQFDHFELQTGLPECPGFSGTKRAIPFAVYINLLGVQLAVPAVELDIIEESNSNSTDLKYFCNSTFATTFQCQLSCIEGLTFDQNCDGDLDYCSNHTCVPNADCLCYSTYVSEVIYVLNDGIWQLAINLTDITVGYSFGYLASTSKTILSIVTDTADIFITLKDKVVKVVQPDQTSFLRLQKDDFSSVDEVKGTTFYKELPASIFSTSGYLYADLLKGDSVIEKTQFKITRRYICEHVDCSDILCTNAANEWTCANAGARAWFLISVTLLFFATIWFICSCTPCWVGGKTVTLSFWLMSLLFECFKSMWNVPRSEGVSGVYQWGKDRAVNIKNKWFIQQTKAEPSYSTVNAEVNVPMRKRYNLFPNEMLMNLIFYLGIFVMIASVGACQDGLFLPVEATTCVTVNATHRTCTLNFQLTASLPYPGSKGCYTVGLKTELTSNFGGNVLTSQAQITEAVYGHIEIDYEAFEATSVLDTIYYTSNWRGSSESRHRCYDQGACKHSQCENLDVLSPTAAGQLSGESTLWPGLSDCERSCGCLTCGCWSCTSSCIFARASIVPQDTIYKVSRPGNSHVNPFVRFNFSLHENEYHVESVKVTNQVVSFNEIQMTVLGTLVGDPISLGDAAIINSGDVAWLQEVSAQNHPTPQRIGDIQASAPSKLSTPSISGFIFSEDLFAFSKSDKSLRYHFRTPGIQALTDSNKMPKLYNGNLWHFLSGNLVSNETNPGALLFKLSTPIPIVWTQEIKTVCPELEPGFVPIMEGCFDCPTGALIRFRIRSTCEAGHTGVYVDELLQGGEVKYTLMTHSIQLETAYSEEVIHFQTHLSTLTVEFEIGTGTAADQTNIVDLDVTGTLAAYVPEVRNTSFQTNATFQDDKGDSLNPDVSVDANGFGKFFGGIVKSIDRAFLGGASLIDKLITAAIIIVATIVILIVAVLTYKLVASQTGKYSYDAYMKMQSYMPKMPFTEREKYA
jgi:hypothetical protein